MKTHVWSPTIFWYQSINDDSDSETHSSHDIRPFAMQLSRSQLFTLVSRTGHRFISATEMDRRVVLGVRARKRRINARASGSSWRTAVAGGYNTRESRLIFIVTPVIIIIIFFSRSNFSCIGVLWLVFLSRSSMMFIKWKKSLRCGVCDVRV